MSAAPPPPVRTGAPARPPRARTAPRALVAAVVVLAALGLPSAFVARAAAAGAAGVPGGSAPASSVLAPAPASAPAPAHAPAPAVADFRDDPTPTPSTVTVTGTGSASAAPDLAVVGMAVEVTAPTAEKALAAQHAAANALLGALRGQQVAERDVRTDSLELSAVYEDGGGASKLTGYRAAQSFSVKVREPHRTGRVVKAAVAAAGDAVRVNGVTFDLADARPLRAEAREAAHADARSKAEHYAALTGRGLGRLVSLTEAESGNPRPLTVSPSAFTKQEGVPVAPGEIQDSVSVVAVYELR
ncbi:SIMPL domain-containing protein [Streptomyces sp. NPDC127108]|uniref:SIMPL domain-containing protein n=1 Tax=Streptomyces sp. NPDC127108 TaxID=3345361 RepID=UPI00363B8EB9